jgi:hypothetical protein
MTEKAQLILAQLNHVSPINIHKKTTADQSLKDSFHSCWFNHTPQAARYMILPYLYDGRVSFK